VTLDDDRADWDGAYLFGALTPEESADYERFLSGDPPRAAALRQYSDIPAILDALSPEEALALLDDGASTQLTPVTPLVDAASKRRERSRRARLATVLASAAALLIIGGVVGYTVIPRPTPAAISLQAMGAGAREGVSASLAVTEEHWGTRFDWKCEYTKNWATGVKSYDLVVTTTSGTQSVVASWSPAGKEASNLAAATVIPTSDIRTVAIRETGTTTPLAVTTLA
jgi:hypothetical protein